MIRRADIIINARYYLNIQAWHPLSDTYVFNAANPNHTFHSAYIIVGEEDPVAQVCRQREYDVMPYVYGGFDTRATFLGRINNLNCPGGWDRVSGNGTKHWYDPAPQGFGYGARVPRNLGGIDCSGYVSRCWVLTRKHSTQTLPNLCVQIDRNSLRQGDILNWRCVHVRIFDSWAGANRVNVYEAAGGGRSRPYNINDEFGCVVYHALNWDDRYIPYSPFPQFTDTNPSPGIYLISQNPTPTISIRCRGSGNIEIYNIGINRQSVAFTQVRRRGIVEASYTPNYDLSSGRYKVDVIAINTVGGQSFWDEYSWEFDLL